MSVSNTTTYVSYVGDGAQDTFPITFDFKATSHVKAILKNIVTGLETPQANPADFGIVGTDVVMATPPTTQEVLIIYREGPFVQDTTYLTTGPFLPADHEEGLDKLLLLIQEVQRDIARCVKATIADSAAFNSLNIISPLIANGILAVNATADGLAYYDPSSLVGPPGPTGPAGPTGAAGSNGANGAGILRAGIESIANGVSTHTVVFSSPAANTNYVETFNLYNSVDPDPIFLQGIVTNKTVNGFTIKFNTPTDTANYEVRYLANDAI